MRKPTTGEPCAGEQHARFGGQGGKCLPEPYQLRQASKKYVEPSVFQLWSALPVVSETLFINPMSSGSSSSESAKIHPFATKPLPHCGL